MVDITRLTRFQQGVARGVDISANTLVVASLKVSTTELTQAILDKLILVQSAAHTDGTFDNRYYTKTEFGSVGATSGADLVATNNTPANYTAAAATVQDHLEGIDAALASAGGNEFADNLFRVTGSVDNTKKVALEVDGLTTATVRTWTAPDQDINFGTVLSDISTNASNISTNSTSISNLVTLSGVAANVTDLGTFTGTVIADTRTVKQALQDLETYAESSRSLIQNFEWKTSVLNVQVDATLDPGATPTTGDRYLITNAAALHANFGTIAGVANNDIVEYNGTAFAVVFTPTVAGPFVSSDADQSGLYQWGGTSWSFKSFEATTASLGLTKVGFDVRLADASATNGIAVSSGVISLQLSATPGLEFSTNLLQAKVDVVGGANLASVVDRNSNGLAVRVDGSTIEDSGTGATAQLRIKAGGIVDSHINASAAIATSKLADAVELAESVTFFANTNITGAEAEQLTNTSNADSLHNHDVRKAIEVAGEAFTAASAPYAVRYGVVDLDTPETAGRVYKADVTELSLVKTGGNKDPFNVIGIVNPGADVSVAGNIEVVKAGKITVTAHGFAIGEPVYLAASGALSSTATTTTGEAVVKLGIAKDANTIEVAIQIMFVN